MAARKVIGLALVLALAVMIGCYARRDVGVILEGDRKVDLRPGQTVNIELAENPTTGYSWELAAFRGEDVSRQVGKPEYTRKSDLIGGGGVRTYRFKALKKGQALLIFEYRRPWEKDKAPAKRHVVTLSVR
jgi:inhibitor of cysteine peptidase